MTFSYTSDELKTWLRADPQHGGQWRHILDGMDRLGHTLNTESLIGRRYDGTIDQAVVSTGAKDKLQALEWAKNAIREWAGNGCSTNSRYFLSLARLWASNGPAKGHTAKCLGSTLDFLHLVSKGGGTASSFDMLATKSLVANDVPAVYCWIFADKFNPADFTVPTRQAVCIQGSPGGGPPGLKEKYWDSVNGTHDDQTHHFAAYFALGVISGTDPIVLQAALERSNDWSIKDQKVINQGDYDLGILGAKFGALYGLAPQFMGKAVEDSLTPDA